MKRFIKLFIVMCASLVLAGCARDFDAVDLFNGLFMDPESTYQYPDLIPSTIRKAGGRLPNKSKDLNEAYALSINDNSLLEGWPEIDFERYSLVIGWFVGGTSGHYIKRQRLQCNNIDKEATLYLEISRITEIDGQPAGYLCALQDYYFAALYPKFDGAVTVIPRFDYLQP